MYLRNFAAMAVFAIGAAVLGAGQQQVAAQAAPAPVYDLSLESNTKFLADNAAMEGVTMTQSGLRYRVIQQGDGTEVASPNDLVTVSYRGSLIDGAVFDETAPGDTAVFQTNRLIPGWVEALQLMREGDEWELVVPSYLGYGTYGAGAKIPPNQTLIFNMRIHHVTQAL